MGIAALLLAFSAAATDSAQPVRATDSLTSSPAVIDTAAKQSMVPGPTPGPVSIIPDTASKATPKAAAGPVPGPVTIEIPAAPSGPIGPVGPVGPANQSVPGPSILVQIDTSGSGTSERSTAAAIGLSMVVPGWGHRYLGYKSRATPYFATDLVGWVALLGSWLTSQAALSNAAEIANRYGNANLGSDPDPNFLSTMRSYRSRRPVAGRHDSYDEAMILSGKNPESEFADDDAHNWDWGTRENPDNDAHIRSFENQVRLWRGCQVAIYATAGSLVLVRLVAAMDVLRLNRSAAGRAGISLETRPLPGGMDATLAVNF